ncbi:MAG: EF-P lysine aminoacylase EpmA [Oligoflexia bacterium]|nr:EF-P lysine aminoacylase EpmA [Oligoflexia bacterium]
MSIVRGRCIELAPPLVILRNQEGLIRARADNLTQAGIAVGDVVEVTEGQAKILTPNRIPSKSFRWMERTLDPRRLHAQRIRAQVEQGVRDFFVSRGFLETHTPLLVPCPGMEPHIRPFRVHSASDATEVRDAYLPTSPEFAMKRLLVGGLERIFQLCPSFRDEPNSTTHHPEFTMLEWYRAYAGYEDIMRDTEELLAFIAVRLFGKPSLVFQNREISVAPPWPRLRVRDLFSELAGIDLTAKSTREDLAGECRRLGLPANPLEEDWDDLYFKIWLNVIEPRLPADRAVFVTRYPASQAALSVIDTDADGSRWARRFEAYAGGLELGNAFEELTDPVEQRRRFEKDMALRERVYGPSFPKNPLDEGFLEALTEGMPPSGGIAVGVDRLVMLFADEADIDRTIWMPSLG